MIDCSWLKERPVAHRGLHDGNRLVWENTLSAFRRAVETGHPIECDVHLTSDGEVIVFHDSDLKRLTGLEGFVHQKTLNEMKAMFVGGTSDQPLSLRDMLDFVAGRVPLVIELKGDSGHDDGLVAAVGLLVKDYSGKVAIMSFDHHLIRQFKRVLPGVAAGLTAEGTRDSDIEGHFAMLAHDIDFVSYNVHHLPNRFITFVREKLRLPVITWTARSPEDFAKTYAEADQPTFEGIDPDEVGMA